MRKRQPWGDWFYTDKSNPGFGIWIDWDLIEDTYFTSSEELRKKYNPYRMKRLFIHITIGRLVLCFRIPYKHVGELYYDKKIGKNK